MRTRGPTGHPDGWSGPTHWRHGGPHSGGSSSRVVIVHPQASAEMDRDMFLLSTNPAARLSRRRLFARIAQHQRSAKATACSAHHANKIASNEKVSHVGSGKSENVGTASSARCSSSCKQGQAADGEVELPTAERSATEESTSGSQSHASSGKSSKASTQNARLPKGAQTERSHRVKSDWSLPLLGPQLSRWSNEPPLFSCKKIVPASPRDVHKKTSSHADTPEMQTKMQGTRNAFVTRAKYYLGVPYRSGARRRDGQPIGPGGYNDKLCLDCCGLVRQCVRDLKGDFGFEIGPWNQAYQMDTLPVALSAEQMKPGDLIFVQGRYHNKGKRRPRNDIVHVEIFLGGSTGEQSIGARNRNGAVDLFDTFRLHSSLYTVDAFHFRSIDTWLRGNCRPVGGLRVGTVAAQSSAPSSEVAPGVQNE